MKTEKDMNIEELPLSYAQQRLWFLDQLEESSAIYNLPVGLRVQGKLNIAALEQSLQAIIARHEALRTNFITVDGETVQIIHAEIAWKLSVVNLQDLPTNEIELTAQQLVEKQTIQPFDLANESLITATLLLLSETENILIVCMHHIVSDGWSIGIFVKELTALYNAYAQGQPTPLAPLEIQYADFALWQRNWLQGDLLQRQLSYWQQQLQDAPALLALPTDRPRPAIQTFNGAHIEFALSSELTTKLTKLSQEQGVTLFMTLLAAYDTLLYRYTGTEDILVGTPIANRDRSEIEGLIGFFVNTLVMRTHVSGNPSFCELMTRVRDIAMEAYTHQHLPFEILVEALQPERDLSHNPLFQVMFILQNAPMSDLDLTGLSVTSLPIENAISKFDLTLSMENTANGLVGVWEYNTDLFDSQTIERMTGHFVTLLVAVVENPQQQISQLPILTTFEQQQLLVEWNNTQAKYPHDKCIHELFEEQVKRTPDAVAVVFEAKQLTYNELNTRANQLAQYLQSLGVGADVLVGICVERSLEMVIGLLGILKAGGAYVPLDPEYPIERLHFMLEDAQVKVLLTQQHLVEKLPEHQTKLVCIDEIWSQILENKQDNPSQKTTASNLANIIYTSGSTGKPKGVMVEHQGLCNLAQAQIEAFGLDSDSRVLQFASLSFDACISEILMSFGVGATLYLETKNSLAPGMPLIERLKNHKITHITLPPSILAVLPESELPTLQTIIVAGEACSLELIKQWSTDRKLFNAYGPTEASVCTTIAKCTPIDQKVTIGRPIANAQVYILDQNLKPLPIGVPGELHISGVGLARGYLNRPELTAEKFITNPFTKSKGRERLYKTGDLARYLPDGNIEYLGRIDNQVKIRGFRIELGEIEAALSQHEDVQTSVVIIREDSPGDKRLVAYIVPQTEIKLESSELRSFLKNKLPEYMIPNAFVFLEVLPLTPNGKVDRRALPTPDIQSELIDKYVAPRTATEEILAQIWAQVLKVDLVGINDNFFILGGHSLLATQLVSRIRSSFKVELPLRSFFATPTVVELGQSIQQLQQEDLELTSPPILARVENVQLPLSYSQQRLWFLDQLEESSAIYNIPVGLRVQGKVNIAALEQSLQAIIARHEALRTNFITVDGETVQIIHAEIAWKLSVVNLQDLPTNEIELTAQQLVEKQTIQPFDLANESLITATLLLLSETENVLIVCMHHIVSDGWSIGIFVKELTALYNAYAQGQPTPLAPLEIQYADFALWQRNWLQGDVLQRQLSYWQQQLQDAPALLALPTDRPRPAIQTFNGAHIEFALSSELTTKLTKLSQEQGVTLFMTLLAAYDTLLYRYTGTEDILVGTPIANRDRSEIEGLIGFFVNTLVMRTHVSGNPSFCELMTRVRDIAMEAYTHQHLPFEILVEALQPERDLSHTPLFQVMFILQNAPMSDLDLTGLSVTSLPIENAISKFDLTLSMENTANGLVGVWEYNTDLFDSQTIERMMGHFVTLLVAIVENPQQQISQLPILTASEQQQLLVEWNDTQADYPQDKCIHQLFEEQVKRTPDAVAVVFADKQLTYNELNIRANQLAHYLQSFGVEANVLVGICVERSLEMIVGLLGILKAGGAYVPLDPDYPQERLSFMLADTQIKVLLTQQNLVEKLQKHQVKLVCLDTDSPVIAQCSQDNAIAPPIADVQATNLAYVIYTSGSTGQPKGVEVVHRGVNRLLFGVNYVHLDETQRFLQIAPISFDASTFEIWGALLHGARCVLFPESIPTAKSLSEEIHKHGITVLWLTSALFNSIIDDDPQALSGIKQLLIGGEALSLAHVNRAFETLPFTQIINGYGPTESTTFTCCYPIPRKIETTIESIPIGSPIANTQVYILDDYLQPVPVGVPGELHVSGAGLARGYLNRPELTQEKFIPNPFDNSKLYKTGDLARYLPDGNIEYVGRIDNQVKIRGFRIELGEIEAVLSQHPQIKSIVAIAREDTIGDKRLVAYIVPHPQQTPSAKELCSFLKTKLPEYMIPNAFVFLEVLPLTPNGKVDRRALPTPDIQSELIDKYVAPRTATEEILAQIWAQVLKVDLVGINDNFFILGGHSLLATQLVSRIRSSFKVELPLRSFFATPTVVELGQSIQQLQQEDLELTSPPILARVENVQLPLSYSQQRLWFLDQLEESSAIYNIPVGLRVQGKVNIAALEQSLQAIIARHEALRTNFITVDGETVQIIHAEIAWKLSVVNLQDLPTNEIELTAQQLVEKQTIQPFDLANESLITATLLLLSETENVLIVCMHHIVSDGWSIGIFVKELTALYNAYAQGQPTPLAPLEIQYADFALWQRNWLQGDVLQRQLSYWQQQLQDAPALLALPTDRPRPAIQTFNGAHIEFALSSELTTKLTKLSQEQGVTLFMTLLAAYDTLLYRYTGTEDI
ncbi:MAG: amino acid adenylation domain-containing protein [Dolichospermum sp. UKL202]